MKKLFKSTILLAMTVMCVATTAVRAQNSEDFFARYYSELRVNTHDGKYGLLFRGEVVIPYEYDAIVAQGDNRGFISRQGSKYGIIGVGDTNYSPTAHAGNISRQVWNFHIKKEVDEKDIYLFVSVVPCEYDKINCTDGRFWVSKGNLHGIYSMSGSNVLPCEYDNIKTIDGRYWVSKGSQTGVYTMSGGTVLRCGEFDDIKTKDGRYWVKKGNKTGICTMSGGTVLRCEFDDIKTVNGRYWVSTGKLKGIYTLSGGTILRCEFDKIELTSDGKYLAYKDEKKSLYSSSGGLLQTEFNVVYSTD